MTERTAWSSPRASLPPGTDRPAIDRPGIARSRTAPPARLLVAVALALLAGGCLGTTGAPVATSANAAPAGKALPARTDPALVPAPELFAADVRVLWDGGSTLGGIWVALPEIDRARQVRLTNTETSAIVDGALIRRDSGQVGPQLIISAEAARSLGIEPNRAVGLQVVALIHPAAEEAIAGEAVADAAVPDDAAVDEAEVEDVAAAAAVAGEVAAKETAEAEPDLAVTVDADAVVEAAVDAELPAAEAALEEPAKPQVAAAEAGTAGEAAATEAAAAVGSTAETTVVEEAGEAEASGEEAVSEPTPANEIAPQDTLPEGMVTAIPTAPAPAPILPVPRPSGPSGPIARPTSAPAEPPVLPLPDESVAPAPLPADVPKPGPATVVTSENENALAPRDTAPLWTDPGVER